MTLVADNGRDAADPGSDVNAYAAWRRLAVAVRQSAIDARLSSAVEWLRRWGDSSLVGEALLVAKSDPDVEGLQYPPYSGGVAGAMAPEVFTAKIPALVSYVREGDAIFGSSAALSPPHAAARSRSPAAAGGGMGAMGALAVGAAGSIVGGLIVVGIVRMLDRR